MPYIFIRNEGYKSGWETKNPEKNPMEFGSYIENIEFEEENIIKKITRRNTPGSFKKIKEGDKVLCYDIKNKEIFAEAIVTNKSNKTIIENIKIEDLTKTQLQNFKGKSLTERGRIHFELKKLAKVSISELVEDPKLKDLKIVKKHLNKNYFYIFSLDNINEEEYQCILSKMK